MIDITKKYRTRDGREVRIYATDGAAELTVHGAVKLEDGWEVCAWRSDGLLGGYTITDSDLVEVRPRIKREVWINVYRGRESIWMTIHDERDEADNDPDCPKMRIACVRVEIDVKEGHGL